MSQFHNQKIILKELEKSRKAIKQKYKLIKHGRVDAERTLSQVFEPIVKPLEELVAKKKDKDVFKTTKKKRFSESMKKEMKDEESEEENSDEKFNDSTYMGNDSSLDQENTVIHASSPSQSDDDENEMLSATSGDDDDDSEFDNYSKLITRKSKKYLDKIYGVRFERDKGFMIGNSMIRFDNNNITVKDVKYSMTTGLLELLIKKQPIGYNANDLQNYKHILERTKAHKKHNGTLRESNSKKFTDIISPMYQQSGSGFTNNLSRYKIAGINTKMNYLYWDDPNELVDRLKLLVAEREAGNYSHNNEILSIIEELREAGYIY